MLVNGASLRVIRERTGMRQSELARAARISRGTLHDLESGRRHASQEVAQRLADCLDIPLRAIAPWDLLTDAGRECGRGAEAIR